LNIFLSGRKIGYAFNCTWYKFFTTIIGTHTNNDSHPSGYILKRFGGSAMGVPHLKNHPLKRSQVRVEAENGMLLA